MLTIKTKVLKKNEHSLVFCCFGTIQGYDHSFESVNLDEAENRMKDLLKRRGITEHTLERDLTIPKPYAKSKETIWSLRPKLDHL
jgi:hypothetical protein